MRIAEYKKIDERIEKNAVIVPAEYDTDGNVIVEEHEEIITRIVPVIGLVYRDMTDEEMAEMQRTQEPTPIEEPSHLDRIEAQTMYTALMTDTLLEV